MLKVLVGILSSSVSWSVLIDKSVPIPWSEGSDKCTTIVVGGAAGTEGPMTTHTADCSNCDFRLNKVPAKDWKEGEKRALYVYKGSYPSQVIEGRGTTWSASNLEGYTPFSYSSKPTFYSYSNTSSHPSSSFSPFFPYSLSHSRFLGSPEQIQAWLKEERAVTGYIPQVEPRFLLSFLFFLCLLFFLLLRAIRNVL